MNSTTQQDFISMLLKGYYYQGFIEGIGVACSDTIVVSSTSSPLHYDPLVQRDTVWSHRIEKLTVIPLKVIEPKRPEIRSQEIMDLYKKVNRPNLSVELKDWVSRLEKEAKEEVSNREIEIRELQEEIKFMENSVDEKVVKNRTKKIENKNQKIIKLKHEKDQFSEVLNEISSLALSNQRYDIRISDSLSSSTTNQGALSFDPETNSILIILPVNANLGFFAHELKHAYQFETGRLSMYSNSKGSIGGGRLYDKYDEMESFNRGSLFGEGSSVNDVNRLPSAYKNIESQEQNVTNKWGGNLNPPLTPDRLQLIANTYQNIIRYNGITYFPRRR